ADASCTSTTCSSGGRGDTALGIPESIAGGVRDDVGYKRGTLLEVILADRGGLRRVMQQRELTFHVRELRQDPALFALFRLHRARLLLRQRLAGFMSGAPFGVEMAS